MKLSLLDLAMVAPGQGVREALHESIELARDADRLGRFERLWFAEHHNMSSIASAATSVLVGQVLAATKTLRVGSGGVMLPNHSPLVIAEQFGTLETLYPGRVDLGLGRAPGTDQVTVRALRRDPRASEEFPADVRELQQLLSDAGGPNDLNAYPGRGTRVPLYILGSSLFGAQLAAAYGLPYAFASHFAPDALIPALNAYREQFRPSEQLQEPYAIAALNVVAAGTADEATDLLARMFRGRVRAMASRVPALAHASDDELMDSMVAQQVGHMLTYTAVGTATEVSEYLTAFQSETGVQEVMVTNAVPGLDNRRRALEIIASV